MTTSAWDDLPYQKRKNLQAALAPAQGAELRYGVPACITLAQFILESNFGNSDCGGARNYFGIKAQKGDGWTGETVTRHTKEFQNGHYVTVDDKFRKYRLMEASFDDHGRFLRNSPRYAPLFKLDKDDYPGWCRGLKVCGYATSPTYAPDLIAIIEKYGLQYYNRPSSK